MYVKTGWRGKLDCIMLKKNICTYIYIINLFIYAVYSGYEQICGNKEQEWQVLSIFLNKLSDKFTL